MYTELSSPYTKEKMVQNCLTMHFEGLLAKLDVKLCTSKDLPGAVHPESLKKKNTPTKTYELSWEAVSLSGLIKLFLFVNCSARGEKHKLFF